jgi:hypothetical protein
MQKKYKVTGEFEGKEINIVVEAVSERQAKMTAGFKSGFGGKKVSEFMKSKSVMVERE